MTGCICDMSCGIIRRNGVATNSRIDTIIGLFCKRDLLKRQYSAKETYDFIDPTDRSPIIPLCDGLSDSHFVT